MARGQANKNVIVEEAAQCGATKLKVTLRQQHLR